MSVAKRWTWKERAACRGTDVNLFFAPDGERTPTREQRERKARKVCTTCPVLADCRQWALGIDDAGRVVGRGERHGFWAAMSEDERAAERRRLMRTDRPTNRAKAG